MGCITTIVENVMWIHVAGRRIFFRICFYDSIVVAIKPLNNIWFIVIYSLASSNVVIVNSFGVFMALSFIVRGIS